jgi:ADP-heptose:LPS heptosyltransferase
VSSFTPSTIAVLQIGRLGDMILTTPLFAGLKKAYPSAHITAIADEAAAIIPQQLSTVDEVLSVRRGFLRIPKLARRIFSSRYDLYIDPKDHRSTTSHLIAGLMRAEVKVAHPANASGVRTLIPLQTLPGTPHYVDLMLAPLQQLEPDLSFVRKPSIDISSEVLRRIDDRINPGHSGMITLNISAGHPSRYWKPEKWKQVVKALAGHHSVAVISSPADRAVPDEICTTRQSARTVATSSIIEAAAVVARSIAVISPDTSIIHLASAFNKPTVGLYPPIDWNAARFAPLADSFRVLFPQSGGSVADIETEEVIESIQQILPS